MNNIKQKLLLTACCLLAGLAPAAVTVTVVDDLGHTVSLPEPAARIISLAPHITENLFAAGVGGQVVGVVKHSDYPAGARAITQIGGYDNFDTELVLSLQPDLVIGWKEGNRFYQVEKLMKLGLPVFINEPQQLEDVARDIIRFGTLGGNAQQAGRVAENYRAELRRLRNQYSELEKVSVFYQVWSNPLITVTDRQIIGNVIRICGGANIFAALTMPTPQISAEAVLIKNPEVIIASGMSQARPEWLDDWKRWPALNATRHGNLFFIEPDIIQRHTPRILQGARQLCDMLEQARQTMRAAAPEGGSKRVFLVPTLLRGNAYITLTVSCSHAGAWEQGETNLSPPEGEKARQGRSPQARQRGDQKEYFSFPRSCVGMHTLR